MGGSCEFNSGGTMKAPYQLPMRSIHSMGSYVINLTLNAPMATKVVIFSHLLKCLRRLYGKQCGPRSDCSYWSSLFLVHAVCLYTEFVSNIRQLFPAHDFSRRHFQMHFFLGALRVNNNVLIRDQFSYRP